MRRRMVDLWFLVGSSPFFFLGAVQGTANESVAAPQGERTSLCYGELGCLTYDATWFDPIRRPVNLLPSERDQINTRFFLYTRHHPDTGVVVTADDVAPQFQSGRRTKFIVHGWIHDNNAVSWMKDMAANLLIHGDYNVLVVDWGAGSALPYTKAVANTRLVGLEIAHLANTLIDQFQVRPSDIHLIGHSLGAQTSGYAGERIPGLGRITGLDPAGPFFRWMPTHVRLDDSDAALVDVIHTNGGDIALGYLGTEQASGHLDFYPNGGADQPGCDLGDALLSVDLDADPTVIEVGSDVLFCSHSRAIDLFIESLVSVCRTTSYECDSFDQFAEGECVSCGQDELNCAQLGIDADEYPSRSRTAVSFYSSTASTAPFCQYQWRIAVSLAKPFFSRPSVNGALGVTLVGDGHVHQTLKSDVYPMVHGSTYRFVIEEKVDVGSLKQVVLSWKYKWDLLDPTTYCFLFCALNVEDILISKMNIYSNQTGSSQTYHFCPRGRAAYARLQSRVSYTFTLC